uniref:L1 transposable element RRM domain-containing protein n=1 Tax=Amphiprion percula TaxID=161767 RepID=A0A3P8SL04_AMPPE
NEPAKLTDLETILHEIREFHHENFENLKEIKDNIRKTNNRIDEAEKWIVETEQRIQNLEETTLELMELQKQVQTRMMDLEGRVRRENVRIHGVKEGAEGNAQSMTTVVENLLGEKLDLPPSFELKLERAHRVLLLTYEHGIEELISKEELIKIAWQKKCFMYEERKVFLDHDYAPEILRKRKEYMEAKKVLREKNIRFQTLFPAKLRVFYEGEMRLYNTAEEGMKDMVAPGLQVDVLKPAEDWTDETSRGLDR